MHNIRRRPRRPFLLLAVLPALLALSACPKPKPPEPPVTDPSEGAVRIDSISPSSTTEGQPVTVTMSGVGFVDGSKVYLGTTAARGVDVYATDELTFRASETLLAGEYDVRMVTPTGDQDVAASSFRVDPRPEEPVDCELVTVFFDFSESKLTEGTRNALTNNAECIEQQGLSSVRIEGHADERGSTIFNLSLGEERAEAARDYLIDLGVSRDVFSIVSYGEERPSERGSGEDVWSRNRRAEFFVQ